MIRLLVLIFCLLINIPSVYAERELVDIDGISYWHGNKNFILMPLSSGSSGRYNIIDLSSIVIKENSNVQTELEMLCYYMSSNGKIEDCKNISIVKKNEVNRFFEIDGEKVTVTPIHINAYYDFLKRIEQTTNGKITISKMIDGYACKTDKYIWYVPRVDDNIKDKMDFENNMAIVKISLSNTLQNLSSSRIIITPLIFYYVKDGHLYDNGYNKFIKIHGYGFAKTMSGRWVRVLNVKSYLSNGGASLPTQHWVELPNNTEGDIIKEVCNMAMENKIK